jgi:hypothetical protein
MNIDWENEPEIPTVIPDYSDLLFAPVGPAEPEAELTTEQRHEAGFRGEAWHGNQLGGLQSPGSEPSLPARTPTRRERWQALSDGPGAVTSGSEVCVLVGWPRRHAYVGAHCPHGQQPLDSSP